MYLAEDRILCWELVSKRGGSWILHYVKSAYAVTDVPDQVSFFCCINNVASKLSKKIFFKVPELISQRRRWLNGSFFAAVHSTFHFHYLYRSSHGFGRKAWIHVELVYQVFNLIFSWFALVRLPHHHFKLSCADLHGDNNKKGKLLYRFYHFIRSVGRPFIQSSLDSYPQQCSQLLLCRFTRYVFPSFAWESTARE